MGGAIYFVYLNWDTLAVVLDRDLASLAVDCYADLAHVLVVLLVIRRVDQDFVEDLIQTRNVGYLAELHRLRGRVVYPHLIRLSLDGTDVRVGALHDVLQMRQL
jgi:hypothetical protein